MQTTIDLVTAIRDHAGSDRKAAPLFGVTQATFSDWRNGDAFPTDDNAIRLAELLNLQDVYVLAVVRRDRATSTRAKNAWQRVAEQFKDAAVVAALAIGTGMIASPSPAQARTVGFDITETQYTLRRNRRSAVALAA